MVVTLGVVRSQSITPDVTINRGSVHRFKASIDDPSYTYQWLIKTLEGAPMSYTVKSQSATSELILFNQEGTYELSVVPAQGENSCPGEVTKMVIKVGIVLEAKITGKDFIGSCKSTLQLDGSRSTGERLSYEWGPKIHFDNPYIAKPTFRKRSATESTKVWLKITDKYGASEQVEKIINFDPAPRAIVKGPNKIKFDSWVLLDAIASEGSHLAYYWSNTDPNAQDYGYVDNSDPSKLIVRKAGTYRLKVMDRNGCVDVLDYVVEQDGTAPITKEDIGITKERLFIDFKVLTNDYDLDNDMDTLSLKVLTPPLHGTATLVSKGLIKYIPEDNYIGEDLFEYEICDLQGNCSTEYVRIMIRAGELQVVRGFSPNGDGINDRFVVKAVQFCEQSEIHIYNRWGDLVYKSNRYGLDGETSWWDGIATEGMSKGNVVPSGTYYYILKTDNYSTKKGYIYISK